MSIHSYPKVYALGHAALERLFDDEVLVEEKIDGSQFSFSVVEARQQPQGSAKVGADLYLLCRSKGAPLYVEAPQKLFAGAIQTAVRVGPKLKPGWVVRGECLATPKHNCLAYDRAPNGNVIVFDINPCLEKYLMHEEKRRMAADLGLECVPTIAYQRFEKADDFRAMLDTISCLGGQKVEGVVVKNYSRFGADGKALMGKFVSEAFKEVHAAEWKKSNPTGGDIIQQLIERYRTPARWAKAVQHLREAGQIVNEPKDIGLLMKEVPQDLKAECEQEIKDALFEWAFPKLSRGAASGLPEWYKQRLLERQFEK